MRGKSVQFRVSHFKNWCTITSFRKKRKEKSSTATQTTYAISKNDYITQSKHKLCFLKLIFMIQSTSINQVLVTFTCDLMIEDTICLVWKKCKGGPDPLTPPYCNIYTRNIVLCLINSILNSETPLLLVRKCKKESGLSERY